MKFTSVISDEVENRVYKFSFSHGKDIKKRFHHTMKVTNNAQFKTSFIYIKVSPSEIVIGGRFRKNFGERHVIRDNVKVNMQSFQYRAARDKGN